VAEQRDEEGTEVRLRPPPGSGFPAWGGAELARTREDLREARGDARRDHLTQVGNRRALDERLAEELARARRYRHDLSVIVADVDGLKSANDAHGHAAGDAVLQAVAKRLSAAVRSSDFVARAGGDELVIVCPELNSAGAREVAPKLAAAVAVEPVAYDGIDLAVSVSVGWATLHGGSDPDDLLSRADRWLYLAKAERATGPLRVPAWTLSDEPIVNVLLRTTAMLPDLHRDAIVLLEVDHLSVEEISTRLDTTVDRVLRLIAESRKGIKHAVMAEMAAT